MVEPTKEAFIPYERADLIQLCLSEDKLNPLSAQKFQEFCQILSAYYHFKFHSSLEKFKQNFASFNPDADTKSIVDLSLQEKNQRQFQLVADFETLLSQANYFPLSQTTLKNAFEKRSLIQLNTNVNFDDFEEIVCYARGDIYKSTYIKKFFRKIPVELDILERVALLIKFKNQVYTDPKRKKNLGEKFKPGKIYLYLYRNIPKHDLEFIFPNVEISMTWKDRIILIGSALGAAIPITLRVLPQLFLVIGVILFLVFGYVPIEGLEIKKEDVNNIMPIMITSLSLIVTLGGFAMKQYVNYKNKQIKFQKDVADTLFFRKLAINLGVFQSLIDSAEEEECKEIILVYYHLLTTQIPLNPEKLDRRIEQWMEEKFGSIVNFDVVKTLRNLEEITGKFTNESDAQEVPLLTYDQEGNCKILSLDKSKKVIDYVWDNAFPFH